MGVVELFKALLVLPVRVGRVDLPESRVRKVRRAIPACKASRDFREFKDRKDRLGVVPVAQSALLGLQVRREFPAHKGQRVILVFRIILFT
jgi:hypothetical protein